MATLIGAQSNGHSVANFETENLLFLINISQTGKCTHNEVVKPHKFLKDAQHFLL